ncbi:MAG: hypothetical protein J5715_05045 [Clostridiales bacterium]|nr:hypothetical protein [Clostridiales bacterium]
MKDLKKVFRNITILALALIAAGILSAYITDSKGTVRADIVNQASEEDDAEEPAQLNGFVKDGGETFYYKDGKKVLGWVKDGSDKYYFYRSGKTTGGAAHTKGAMATGWQTIDGERFYFYRSSKTTSGSAHNKGAMATGWQSIDGEKFYFYQSSKTTSGSAHSKGAMATGWQKIDDQKFFFYRSSKTASGKAHTKGAMVTGWQTIDGEKYYFYKTAKTSSGKAHRKGAMATGWQTISKEKYYFYKSATSTRKSGVMAKGGINISNKGYIFDETGKLVMSNMKGWYKVGEDYYYCDRKSGKLFKNDTANGIYLRNDGKAQLTDFAKEKIPVMIRSREIVAEITNKNDTLTQKKWKCYKYVAKFPYIYKDAPIGDHIKAKDYACWDAHYANNILNAYGDQKTCGGECCAQSVALGYLFTELNFGTVTFNTSYTHGWIEVNGLCYDTLFIKSRGMDWWEMKHYPATPSYSAVI